MASIIPGTSQMTHLPACGLDISKIVISLGIKSIKYFIDSSFRKQAHPVPGSVLYCDLWVAAEHSGIYVDDGQISNIVVDQLLMADSSVRCCGPESFTSKSSLGRKIYVSCDQNGAVGHPKVAHGANSHTGKRAFYGLVFKNCHDFSKKCVDYADNSQDNSPELDALMRDVLPSVLSDTWEPTIGILKETAYQKLGATKWRLWDWDGSCGSQPPPEPDWQSLTSQVTLSALNAQSILQIQQGLSEIESYMVETADEGIPASIRNKIQVHANLLATVSKKYDEVRDFLDFCIGTDFSYTDLQDISEEFRALAQTMKKNDAIKGLVTKMGRSYVSEKSNRQARTPQADRSELHGIHQSDDVMRMLPSELLHLEDEVLENLFYARLLEKQLQTYELQGSAMMTAETLDERHGRTGPVVACLDTSGSMQGLPLLKAKALLLAIASILQQEQRSLHVLLFGSTGEMREFTLDGIQGAAGLLRFLAQSFGGGTDLESPLNRALEMIENHPTYEKADLLMISDGDGSLSQDFMERLHQRKKALGCILYSVRCNGQRVADGFSDEVIVI